MDLNASLGKQFPFLISKDVLQIIHPEVPFFLQKFYFRLGIC